MEERDLRIGASDDVWVLTRFDVKTEPLVFNAEHLALLAAETIVGNRAAARPNSNLSLYGPGDGTTSLTVERFSRRLAVMIGLSVPLA